MTDRPNLLEAIREADGTLSSVRLGPHASHRIRTAIREHATGQGRAWFVPAALGAAALLLALAMGGGRRFQSKSVEPGECIKSSSADTIALNGPCKMSLGAMDIETSGATTLSETPDGARLRSGMAIFHVRPVPAGHEPVRIRVGGGVIEVMGTTFVLEQHRGGGSVELLEGTIRFVSSSHQSTILHAGERLSWVDDAPPPSSDVSSAAPHFPGTSSGAGSEPADNGREPPEDIDADDRPRLEAALRRFKQLRREAHYIEQERLRDELEPASFELGNALESAQAERSRICAHWRWHLGRFSAGIYNGAIEQKMRKLRCPP